MPSLTIKVKTTISPEQFLEALTNFDQDRAVIWGNSQSSHLVVHKVGSNTADVTEGSRAFGGVWERLRYEWSNPAHIELRTIDSNIWTNDSGWRYEIEQQADELATYITATVTRYPNSKKGYLVLLVVSSVGRRLITNGFRQTIRTIEERYSTQP